MHKKYKEDTIKKVLEEIKGGKSQMQVAKQRKIPRATVWAWCKKAGMVTPMKKKAKVVKVKAKAKPKIKAKPKKAKKVLPKKGKKARASKA